MGILKGTPRAAEDHQQEVVGLFRTYDAGASFNNQEATPVKIPLFFTEEHVKIYDAASAQVAASTAKSTGDKLVKQLVALCLCEIKFMFGCSVPWDKIPVAGQSASADQGSEPASVAASMVFFQVHLVVTYLNLSTYNFHILNLSKIYLPSLKLHKYI